MPKSTLLVLSLAALIAAFGIMAGCSGDDSASNSPTAVKSSTLSGTTGALSTSTAGSVVASGAASGLLFKIDGNFKGSPVKGDIIPGGLTCSEVGSASSPLVLVLWSGTVGVSANNPNKQVSGEVRGPAGTYPGPGGEGIASITIAGDYANSPAWTSGAFTINADAKSGTVSLVFGTPPDEATLTGTFICS